MVFVQETDSCPWKQKVRLFEEEIVNERMRASGNWGRAGHSNSIGQSRISCKARNSRVIIEHHLFEESYSELAERRSTNVNGNSNGMPESE